MLMIVPILNKYKTKLNVMKNITIDGPCNTDCIHFYQGDCPFKFHEKETKCPKWQIELKNIKYIVDAIEHLNKYYEIYTEINIEISKIVISYDNGIIIIHLDMVLYEMDIKWKIPDMVKTMPGNGTKTDYICLAVQQILDRILKKNGYD